MVEMALLIDACIAQHQGDRKEQQDRVALFPHPKGGGMLLAIVADGMGGHAGGALAAEQVLYTVRNNFNDFVPNAEASRGLLESSLREAHTLIKASRFINEKDPHSTAVMMVLQPGKISWAHCGDSRFHWFRDDVLFFISKDHSYVEELIDKGEITPEEALMHPSRNILVTSLGGEDEPLIDFCESEDVRANDIFVLCSDGLSNYFSHAEIGAIVSSYNAREATNLLINRARVRSRGAGDNISVAIIKLFEEPSK